MARPRTSYKALCLDLEQRNRQLANQVEYLVRTIRDMDQEIWNMSQRTDWNSQRPHYNKLQEGMIARKHAESERINTIIRGEIIDTYAGRPNNAPKRLTGPK